MGNILGLVVTYKWVFVGVAIFLILALIGAFADKKQSQRFKFAEKKDEVNLTAEAKGAGETADASATANNRAVGSEFTSEANNNPQSAPAASTNASAPAETASNNVENKVEEVPATAEPAAKTDAVPAPVETPKA